jgi:hypothetical protein
MYLIEKMYLKINYFTPSLTNTIYPDSVLNINKNEVLIGSSFWGMFIRLNLNGILFIIIKSLERMKKVHH